MRNNFSAFNHGDSSSLLNIPSGALIHNLGGQYCRAAGCSTILVRKDVDQALIKMKSGELRFFSLTNIASFGSVGNEAHFLENLKTAGRARRFYGKRPRPRPSASNPVDILWVAVQEEVYRWIGMGNLFQQIDC